MTTLQDNFESAWQTLHPPEVPIYDSHISTACLDLKELGNQHCVLEAYARVVSATCIRCVQFCVDSGPVTVLLDPAIVSPPDTNQTHEQYQDLAFWATRVKPA